LVIVGVGSVVDVVMRVLDVVMMVRRRVGTE
jgi:hypothetical protein